MPDLDFETPALIAPSEELQTKTDALPRHAAAFLIADQEAQYAYEGAQDRKKARIAELREDIAYTTRITNQHHFDITRRGVKSDRAADALVATADKEVLRKKKEIEQLSVGLDQGYASSIATFWPDLQAATIPLVDDRIAAPPIPKGSSFEDACNNGVARIKTLRKDQNDIRRRSQPPLEAAIAKYTEDVEQRASENSPTAEPLLKPMPFQVRERNGIDERTEFRGNGAFGWPVDYPALAEGRRKHIDLHGLMFWAMKEIILEKGIAEIRRLHKPELVRSQEERNRLCAEIDAEILGIEREICAYIEAAALQGIKIPYPRGLSWRAVLGLKFEGE